MRPKLTQLLGVLAIVSMPLSASAETILQNDGVGEMFDATTATVRLIEGEMYEAVFDIPEEWLPIEMLGVRVVMVKSNTSEDPSCPGACALGCGRFGIDVWEEGSNQLGSASCIGAGAGSFSVGYKDPGTQLFTQDAVLDPQTNTVVAFEVRGDDTRGNATFKDLRFSSINSLQGITLNPVMLDTQRVRVALRAIDLQCTAGGMIQSGDHFPVLLSDEDGVSAPLKNFVYGEPLVAGFPLCSGVMGPQHYVWEDFGPAFQNSQPGDFVMRLILDRDGAVNPNPDMGNSTDMGTGGVDMSMPSEDMGTGEVDMSTPPADMGGGGDDAGNNNATNNGMGGGLMLDSITPSEGPNTESVNVVITGSGFEAGVEVLLGADNIGVTETRDGRIRATVPDGFDPGTYDVVVTNPDGETAILMGGYTVTEGIIDGDGKGGAGSDGCCAEVRGPSTTSGVGAGLGALLLAFVVGIRRRR